MMIILIAYINEMHGFIFLRNDHHIYCPSSINDDKNNKCFLIKLIGLSKTFLERMNELKLIIGLTLLCYFIKISIMNKFIFKLL